MGDELQTLIEPGLRERRLELERARARLAELQARDDLAARNNALEARVQELEDGTRDVTAAHRSVEHECALAHQRIDALHRSWSWRVTAPLRRVYEWIARP
jgi:hypothetical protein